MGLYRAVYGLGVSLGGIQKWYLEAENGIGSPLLGNPQPKP